jgi:hypothetical protein
MALREASWWARPFVFLRHADTAIAQATWQVFKPAVPTTLEGLVYALVGVAVALFIVQVFFIWPVRVWRNRRRRGLAPAAIPG